MLDISRLNERYGVRRMKDPDADDILELCRQNTQFYRYCGRQPSRALVLNDLHITPPGIDAASKYYVGFYDGAVLVAIMDLIDGYPEADCAYIGFFMVNKALQGKQIGSQIIGAVCRYLKGEGYAAVQLAIDKGNPQSTHFWSKNGFAVVREVQREGWTVLVAERPL